MSKNFVATTKDNLETVLKKVKRDDTLLLFYYNEHKTIDINLLSIFAKSGINLELKELPESNSEIYLAFELGKLASTGSVTSISKDSIVSGFSLYLTSDTKTRKSKKKEETVAPKPRKKREPKLKSDSEEIKQEEEQKENTKKEPVELKSKEEKSELSRLGIKPDEFDEAFDDFMLLLAGFDVSDFNPMDNIQKILETIRAVEINKENMLAVCVSIFGSNKNVAYDFIKSNYKKLKAPALRVIKLDS